MTFVHLPPPELGPVAFSWTNNGPDGPAPKPLGLKLMIIGLCAAAGFVLGLIGFFLVGGILQSRHHSVGAAWFLCGLGGGSLAGALAGVAHASRPPKVSTLYVGRDGCADFSGDSARVLLFRDVEDLRSHVSVMSYKGVRTEAREIHVKQNGRERLYLVSAAKGDDPQVQYCDAVLSAFQNAQWA